MDTNIMAKLVPATWQMEKRTSTIAIFTKYHEKEGVSKIHRAEWHGQSPTAIATRDFVQEHTDLPTDYPFLIVKQTALLANLELEVVAYCPHTDRYLLRLIRDHGV